MLDVSDITVLYGGFRALRGVSLRAAPGSIVGLVGPNGSGKSTLLNVVAGVQRPVAGSLRLDGRLIPFGAPERMAHHGIGRTFQVPRLARRLTVFQNVQIGARDQPGETVANLVLRPARVRSREREIAAAAHEALRRVELGHKAGAYAGDLSGGQQKLLSLAMMLMAHPRVVLLDEPAAGVNPVLVDRQIQLLRDLRDEGRIVVLVDHNMEMIASICDRVVVLDAGEVIAEGTPAAIRADDRVMRSYLGEPAVETS
ncbi:MAG TPA: ABC transporter ATP-binding protein [Lichenihabitans sp.]|jgi:ABC-type branched-subunit amino acid transport system ATPase component|nr:ABC transporter ATP-binding protein [Lichenihabitans sp.]